MRVSVPGILFHEDAGCFLKKRIFLEKLTR